LQRNYFREKTVEYLEEGSKHFIKVILGKTKALKDFEKGTALLCDSVELTGTFIELHNSCI